MHHRIVISHVEAHEGNTKSREKEKESEKDPSLVELVGSGEQSTLHRGFRRRISEGETLKPRLQDGRASHIMSCSQDVPGTGNKKNQCQKGWEEGQWVGPSETGGEAGEVGERQAQTTWGSEGCLNLTREVLGHSVAT
jgi:hypothetical protein